MPLQARIEIVLRDYLQKKHNERKQQKSCRPESIWLIEQHKK